MSSSRLVRAAVTAGALTVGLIALPRDANAHCDTMDGPVVVAAQQALQTGELEPMLIWVREQDEPEIRHAFDHVRRVRDLGGDAATLADRFFFETVVRIHREGEGEPYTGLKPAGTDLGRAVPAADLALENGSVEGLRAVLHGMVDQRLDAHFAVAQGKRAFDPNDVAAGREFVAAYVQFMHFAEVLEAIAGEPHHGHGGAAQPHPPSSGHAH